MSEELKLTDREWREFFFSDIFTSIQRGKRLKKDDHRPGGMPYVSSSANNNGIDGFIGNTDEVRIFENCISLANSGSVGSAFFQAYAFVASDHVTKLERTGLDRYAYFSSCLLSRASQRSTVLIEKSTIRDYPESAFSSPFNQMARLTGSLCQPLCSEWSMRLSTKP